jgi:K+-transporting ATPase ATPase A chain
MGNFYLDMWRGVAYFFVPLCLIVGVLLIAGGVPMTFHGAAQVTTLEPGAMGATPDGQAILTQSIARGPVAAIIAVIDRCISNRKSGRKKRRQVGFPNEASQECG